MKTKNFHIVKILKQCETETQFQNLTGKKRLDLHTLLRIRLGALVIVLLFSSSVVQAVTRTSTASGGAWSSTSTWTAGVVPSATDDVVIATTGANSVTMNADYTILSLQVNSGSILSMNTSQLTVDGAVNNAGTITVSTGRIMQNATGDFTNSGTITYTGAGRIYFSGNMTNSGTLTLASAQVRFVGSDAVAYNVAGFTTTGVIDNRRRSGSVTFTGNVSGASLLLDNNRAVSTVNLGAGLTHTISGAVTLGVGTLNGGTSTLNIGGNVTGTSFTAGTGTINYIGTGQTAGVWTYNNLILSGSGTKTFATTPTVNGVLSLEGTASVVVTTGTVTYGTNATLQYNKPAPYTATSEEWITPFAATGGVIIANTGAITMNSAKVFNTSAPLTVSSGSTLSMSTYLLTLNGDLINNGGTISGTTGGVTITGTATQAIGAFTTTGTVSMTKTSGTATFGGIVNGGILTLNGNGGTLDLGSGLTHTFTGNWNRNNGTLNGGSSHLILGGSVSGTTGTFTAGTGTVEWNSAGPQTLASVLYNNLILSVSGAKSFSGATTINGNMSISGTASANLGTFTSNCGTLTIGGAGHSTGSWGGTGSGATNINTTYFQAATGILNVGAGCVAGTWTGVMSSDWNDSANWCTEEVPTASTNVVINSGINQPIITSQIACNNLTINSGVLTISSSGSLTVSGTITNTVGTSGLVIKSDGTDDGKLINNNSSVPATVELFLTGGGSTVHYFVPPVSSVTIGSTVIDVQTNLGGTSDPLNTFAGYLYSYSESVAGSDQNNGWQKFDGTPGFTSLNSGQGYAIRLTGDDKLEIKGDLNSGNAQFTLTRSAGGRGWNLVGNPYPSNYNLDGIPELQDPNNGINKTLYFYKGGSYVYKNIMTRVTTPDTDPLNLTSVVPPMRGFFINVSGTYPSYKLNLPATNDLKPTSGEIPRAKALSASMASNSLGIIRLKLNNSASSDETIVCLADIATTSFDSDFDAYKLFGSNRDPYIYTELHAVKYSINTVARPVADPVRVPVTVDLKSQGDYKIDITQFDNLYGVNVVLKHGAIVTNLKLNTSYSFTSAAGTFTDFELIIGGTATGLEKPDLANGKLKTWYSNNFLYINCSADITGGKGTLFIYNILGGQVYNNRQLDLTQGQTMQIPLTLPKGVYVTNVKVKDQTFMTKIIVL